jgi:hypothetical protein
MSIETIPWLVNHLGRAHTVVVVSRDHRESEASMRGFVNFCSEQNVVCHAKFASARVDMFGGRAYFVTQNHEAMRLRGMEIHDFKVEPRATPKDDLLVELFLRRRLRAEPRS